MPAKKISELAAAATPLTGAEQLPAVQSSSSVRTTIAQIVDHARATLQGAEVLIRAAPASGAGSGVVDLSGVGAGLSVLITGGAPAYTPACACAATANITRSGEQTIDGVATSSSRVLLTGQTDATKNGIWITSSVAWTRAADAGVGEGHCDDPVSHGQNVKVSGGSANAGTWTLTTANPIALGTTALAYAKDATAAKHNLAFSNPAQTFSITGFTGMRAGALPFTVRFDGTFLLDHGDDFYLSNNGQDYLTMAGDMALVFPTGTDSCRVKLYPFNDVLTVRDARASDGEGQRDIHLGGQVGAANPAFAVRGSADRWKTYMTGEVLMDLGDTPDVMRGSLKANGDSWDNQAQICHTYASTLKNVTLNAPWNVLGLSTYYTGRMAQHTEVQLETPSGIKMGGGHTWGVASPDLTTAGEAVPWDAVAILPSTAGANTGAGRGLVCFGRTAYEESGYSHPHTYDRADRAFHWGGGGWGWGTGRFSDGSMVKGSLTVALSDEAAKFAGIALRTAADHKEGFDFRYNASLDELRLGVVSGDAYTAKWGITKSNGDLLPLQNGGRSIGSSSRRLAKLWTLDLDASGTVVLGDSAGDSLVMNAKSITKPNMPAFFAYLSATASNVTGDATVYDVAFNTELYDRGGDFDVSTGMFTAPVAGLYDFQSFTIFSGVDAAMNRFISVIRTKLSGTDIQVIGSDAGDLQPDVNGIVGVQRAGTLALAQGEQVFVRTSVSGSAKTADVVGAGTGSPINYGTYFCGRLVG